MLKIKIKGSVEAIKKELLRQQKVFTDEMIPEYLRRAVEWIRSKADEKIDLSEVGSIVKDDIKSNWMIESDSTFHIRLRNTSSKAVYVEFGVGIVGQSSKHPNAVNTGYEYNVPSRSKFGNGFWGFTIATEDQLDIPQDAIVYQDEIDMGIHIITQGTQGSWYLFNALEDFRLTEQRRLWQEIKEKYWS